MNADDGRPNSVDPATAQTAFLDAKIDGVSSQEHAPSQVLEGANLNSDAMEALRSQGIIRAHLGSLALRPANATTSSIEGIPDRRARLLAHIQLHPGCVLREAGRGIGLRHQALLRHLAPMIDRGEIFAAESASRVYLFPQMPGIESCWTQVVALRDTNTALMHTVLLAEKCSTHTAILEGAHRQLGLSLKAASGRLRVLLDAFLVSREPRRSVVRATQYRAVPVRPETLEIIRQSAARGHAIASEVHELTSPRAKTFPRRDSP